jgi:hypothetical protein
VRGGGRGGGQPVSVFFAVVGGGLREFLMDSGTPVHATEKVDWPPMCCVFNRGEGDEPTRGREGQDLQVALRVLSGEERERDSERWTYYSSHLHQVWSNQRKMRRLDQFQVSSSVSPFLVIEREDRTERQRGKRTERKEIERQRVQEIKEKKLQNLWSQLVVVQISCVGV